jgi:hypothetical protein
VLKTDGTVLAVTINFQQLENAPSVYFESGFELEVVKRDNNTLINFDSLDGHTANIAAVKLELGPVSTLALDPPADYGETLRKCLRYYLGAAYVPPLLAKAQGTAEVRMPLAFPVPMRAFPTLIVGDLTNCLRVPGGPDVTPTDVLLDTNYASGNSSYGGCMVAFQGTFNADTVYGYKSKTNAIAFSAEL